MMKRKESQEKFHESLLNMLYAPSPPPPRHKELDEQTLNFVRGTTIPDHPIYTDELGGEDEKSLSSSGGDEDEDESGSQKLTRAQRKRLRKKKLKEAASHRRKIIGPQLPGTNTSDDQVNCEGGDVTGYQHLQGVRQNATQEIECGNDGNHGGEGASCTKVKQRRMSKKLARDKPKPPPADCSPGVCSPQLNIGSD